MCFKMWALGHVHVLDVSSARMEMQKTLPEKDSFPVQTPRLSPFNTISCCEEALYPVIYSISMRGKTGKLFFFPVQHLSESVSILESIHAGQDNPVRSASMVESIHAGQDNVRVSSASMIESIRAGQDNVRVSSASMIESIHAGQDNVHVSSASMIESIHAGQDNVRVSSD